MKIVYNSQGIMKDTPAAIDRKAGILYINPKRYFALTPFQQKFVKFHEYGHYNLNTDSEIAADEYAFNQLAGTEFRSLKQCIECLEELLDEDKIGHKIRIDHMYGLALKWDREHPELNKMAGSEEAAKDDAYTNVILAQQTGTVKTLSTTFNGLQNLLNSILITGVLVVAMFFILKNTD